MSLFDGNILTVTFVTQEMLNWLEESDMLYHIVPHLERYKYSGCFGPRNSDIKVGGRGDSGTDPDFRKVGDDIIFDKEEDRMHFAIRFGEDIHTGDEPFEF